MVNEGGVIRGGHHVMVDTICLVDYYFRHTDERNQMKLQLWGPKSLRLNKQLVDTSLCFFSACHMIAFEMCVYMVVIFQTVYDAVVHYFSTFTLYNFLQGFCWDWEKCFRLINDAVQST